MFSSSHKSSSISPTNNDLVIISQCQPFRLRGTGKPRISSINTSFHTEQNLLPHDGERDDTLLRPVLFVLVVGPIDEVPSTDNAFFPTHISSSPLKTQSQQTQHSAEDLFSDLAHQWNFSNNTP